MFPLTRLIESLKFGKIKMSVVINVSGLKAIEIKSSGSKVVSSQGLIKLTYNCLSKIIDVLPVDAVALIVK